MKITYTRCDLCNRLTEGSFSEGLTIADMDFCDGCKDTVIQRIRRFSESTFLSNKAKAEAPSGYEEPKEEPVAMVELAEDSHDVATESHEVEKEAQEDEEEMTAEKLAKVSEKKKGTATAKPKANPKTAHGKRLKEPRANMIDWDKAVALKKSGWKNRDIAVELGINSGTLDAMIYKKLKEFDERKAREAEAEKEELLRLEF